MEYHIIFTEAQAIGKGNTSELCRKIENFPEMPVEMTLESLWAPIC